MTVLTFMIRMLLTPLIGRQFLRVDSPLVQRFGKSSFCRGAEIAAINNDPKWSDGFQLNTGLCLAQHFGLDAGDVT
jgi:hypothetical protein